MQLVTKKSVCFTHILKNAFAVSVGKYTYKYKHLEKVNAKLFEESDTDDGTKYIKRIYK